MRRLKIFTVVTVGLLAAFSSCKKSGPTTFTLQMKAKFGNQNFVINTSNTDSAGRYIQAQNLEFYLSHINLIKTDGSLVPVSQVAVFNFGTPQVLSVSANNIEGSFTGISFVCGLDSLVNDTTSPELYSAPNPLSGDYNMAWGMIYKYQFEMFDGLWDVQDTFLHRSFAYHIGTNPAYRSTHLNKAFSVSGTPYTMVLYLDLAQIFNNSTTGERLDIATQGASMSTNTDNPVILPTFSDNFSNSFTFNGP